MVITGDPTQIDLPRGETSGLAHALGVLSSIQGIAFTWLDEGDIVRHSLVQQIVDAYEKSEGNSGRNRIKPNAPGKSDANELEESE